MLKALVRVFFVFFMIFAVGCGGGNGGGGGDDPPDPVIPDVAVGQFVDCAVKGLVYKAYFTGAEDLVGVTDENGTFEYYVDSETEEPGLVEFFVGNISIGQVQGEATITPFTLAGIDPLMTATAARDAEEGLKVSMIHYLNFRDGIPKWRFIEAILPAAMSGDPDFQEATNITLFLQTMDADEDCSNGIQIPDLGDITDGVTLNFDQDTIVFLNDPTFLFFMSDARQAGLWGGSRAIVNPGLALNNLYAGLGFTPTVPVLGEIENTDGSSEDFVYDADGVLLFKDYLGANDDFIGTDFWEYDDNYNVTENEWLDGSLDPREYDANGNISLAAVDTDADGITNNSMYFGYDAGGTFAVLGYDAGKDGILDVVTENVYEVGSLRVVRLLIYTDADDIADQVVYWTWSDGKISTVEVDYNADGFTDYQVDYTYGIYGLTGIEADDYNVVVTYTTDGSVESVTRTGTNPSTTVYQYDVGGNCIGQTADNDGNGTVDEISTFIVETVGGFGFYGSQLWANGFIK